MRVMRCDMIASNLRRKVVNSRRANLQTQSWQKVKQALKSDALREL
jgi:hypothetical protein